MLAALGAMMSGGAEQGIDSINKNVAADLMLEKEKRQREWKTEDDATAETRAVARDDRTAAREEARWNKQAERDDKRWNSQAERDAAKETTAQKRHEERLALDEKRLAQQALRDEQRYSSTLAAINERSRGDGDDKATAKAVEQTLKMAEEARQQGNMALASSYLEQARETQKFGPKGAGQLPPREKPGGPLATKTDAQRSAAPPPAKKTQQAAAPASIQIWNDAELGNLVMSKDPEEARAASDELRRRMFEREAGEQFNNSGGGFGFGTSP